MWLVTAMLLCVLAVVATGNPTREKRLAVKDTFWEDGIIPYEILNISKRIEVLFNEAVKEFNNVSCVRWVHKSDPVAIAKYPDELTRRLLTVQIFGMTQWYQGKMVMEGQASVGCTAEPFIEFNIDEWEYNGKRTGYVEMKTVLHEMMHVMGFKHEHNRTDAHEHLLYIAPKEDRGWITYNLPFDYASVMLYGHLGLLNSHKRVISNSLSKQDILIINLGYQCYPKDQEICKSIDYTNLRHFIPNGEMGIFSQFNANFTKPTTWTATDTIRIGERCASPDLKVGCLVESTNESGTVKTQFAENGCWIEHKGHAVKCDLTFEDKKLTSVNFPLSQKDQSDANCFIQLT